MDKGGGIERDPNRGFCLTDVVEWVRVTSLVAESDHGPRRAVTTRIEVTSVF